MTLAWAVFDLVQLVAQLHRLRWEPRDGSRSPQFIHNCGVDRLRRALDLLEAQEAAEAAAKSKP